MHSASAGRTTRRRRPAPEPRSAGVVEGNRGQRSQSAAAVAGRERNVRVIAWCSEVQHADPPKPSDDIAEQEFVFVDNTGVPGAEEDGTYSCEVYPKRRVEPRVDPRRRNGQVVERNSVGGRGQQQILVMSTAVSVGDLDAESSDSGFVGGG